MSNLATITNNILADSGIDDINVIVSTGSYSNPAWITALAWTKITGAPSGIVTGTGTTNVVPKFTGTSTIGDSAISDNTNEVSISKRLFLNTGGQSILLTPNISGVSNRIESSALPLEITTLGSALRLAAGGVTAQLTLASTGVVTLTNLAGTGSRIVVADSSGNLSASSALSGYVQGTGTTNYLPKFTGASTIGNSQLFDNGTNVGINQPSPTRTLDILGALGIGTVLKLQGASGTTTYLQLAYNGATNAQSGYIGYNSSSQMQFFTNDTLGLTIDSNRNVGIGTATPNDKFHVVGGIYSTSLTTPTNTNIGAIQIGYDGTNGIIRTWNSSPLIISNFNYQAFETTGSERLRITGTGNVGIGTATPAQLFTVRGSATNLISLHYSNDAGGVGYGIYNSAGTELWSIGGGRFIQQDELAISRQGVAALYINSSRNVLIGTTTDNGARLQVSGDVTIINSDARLRGGDVTGRLVVGNSATSTYGIFYGSAHASVPNTIVFATNSAQALIIGSNQAATFSSSVTAVSLRSVDPANTFSATFGANSATPNWVAVGTIGGVPSINGYTNTFSSTTNLALQPNGGNVLIGNTSAYTSRLTVQAAAANRPAIKAGFGVVSGNGYWVLGDNYTLDESLTSYGIDYSSGDLVLGSIVAPSTTTSGAFISTQAQFGNLGSAIRAGNSGDIYFFRGTSTSVVPVGGAKSMTESIRITSSGTLGFNGNSNIGNAGLDKMSMGYLNSTYGWIQTWNSTPLVINGLGNPVLIGTTTDAGYTLNVAGNAQFVRSGTSTAMVVGLSGVTGSVIRFSYNGGFVGSISTDGSNTAYNTSSDYRLKQDIKDFNGLDLLSRIKTYDFEWKSDKTRSYGVLAHELQEVINYAVTGSKDAEEMQGVDYSKIVPILIKAIQELNEKIK